MSTCTLLKDKLTKNFVDKNAINVSDNKIKNVGIFNQLNKAYSTLFAEQFSSIEKDYPFKNENGIALVNEEYITKIDRKSNPELDFELRFKEDIGESVPKDVKDVFDSKPELAEIGTVEQYNAYTKTIFPESKVKDIVYHVSDAVFSEFKKQDASLLATGIDEGIYFSKDKNYYSREGLKNTYAAMVNLSDFTEIDHLDFLRGMDGSGIRIADNKSKDGFITKTSPEKDFSQSRSDFYINNEHYREEYDESGESNEVLYTKDGDIISEEEYDLAYSVFTKGQESKLTFAVVNEPKQTHILGSKNDVKSFKEYVSENRTEETEVLSEELNNIERTRRQETTNKKLFERIASFNLPNMSETEAETNFATTQDKIDMMKKVFDAEVLEDTELSSSAVLLASNNPIAQQYDKPVIVINPNKLFSDTVFHEFGHLYIDLLGGLKDPVVNMAIDQLMDSELWLEVENNYPHLQDEDLAKEVLATAIGIKGNNIYKGDVAQETKWQALKRRILTAVSKLFGTNYQYNALERIASEMLTGNVRIDSTTEFNTRIDQHSNYHIKEVDLNQTSIKELFRQLSSDFNLDHESHIYENTVEKKKYSTSATSFGKSLTGSKRDPIKKGDYNTPLDKSQILTKTNMESILDSSTIAWSLDQAILGVFSGKIGNMSTVLQNNTSDYWYTYLSDPDNKPLYDKIISSLEENIVEINKEAARLELKKSRDTVMGNIVHEALEDYINQRNEGVEDVPFPDQIEDENKLLYNTIKSILDKGYAKGSMFYPEQILFSEVAQTPGTADLIEITKDGTFKLYDFKTAASVNTDDYHAKTDTQLYIDSGYMNQLIIYTTMLEEYNLKPAKDHMNLVYIKLDKDAFDPAEPSTSPVVIDEVTLKTIDPSLPELNSQYKNSKASIVAQFRNAKKLSAFNIKDKQKTIEELLSKIQRGLKDYRKLTNERDGGKFTKEGEVISENANIYKIETDIKQHIGAKNTMVMYRYIANMRDALNNVYKYSMMTEAQITPGYVQNMEYLLQASSFINEVIDFVEHSGDDFALEGLDKIEVLNLLKETNDAANKVREMKDLKGKQMTVNTLAMNSNIKQGYFAEQYEIEARANGKKTKAEIYEYVYNKLKDNETEILISEKTYWHNMLTNGYTDIRKIDQLFADPGMNRSQFVQVVKNILDKVDNDMRIDLDKSIPEIVKWYEGIKEKKKGNPESIWADFLEVADFKDIDGKPVKFTHSSVISEETSDYREKVIEYKYLLEDIDRKVSAAFSRKNEKLVEELKKKRKEIIIKRNIALKNADTSLRPHPRFAALSKERKETLRFIHKKLEISDNRLYADKSKQLVTHVWDNGSKIYDLPKMRKSNAEAIYDIKTAASQFKSKVNDFLRPPADEDELGMNTDEDASFEDFNTRDTDILGNSSFTLPVFFRKKLEDPTLQSFDIPTLLAMNEETTIAFENKKMVEADLYMIMNSLKNATAHKTDAFISKKVVDKEKDSHAKALRSEDNRTLKAVEASINNRFYKRSYIGTYSKWNYRAIKAGEAVGKITSAVLLGGNFGSATMTGVQGSIYRIIEGRAGEHFNLSDVATGTKKAYSDIGGLIADTQKQFPDSKTNLLIRRFGLETQYEALVNKFVQDNFVTKNLDESAMYSVTSIAESIVTANLMYTLLNNIKVMNNDRKYINKEGVVVNKKDAMSLDEAYDVVDGVLVLNKNVAYTENNLHNKYTEAHVGEKTTASTEISGYIRGVYADLYGQYNQDLKSMIEMNIAGKLAMSMRKWLPRGAHRRWRGITSSFAYTFEDGRDPDQADLNLERRFYSQEQKRFQEGYYSTGARYLYSIYKMWKEDANLGLMAAGQQVNKDLTFHQTANLRRLLSEGAVITLSIAGAILTAMLAKSLADDDDDSSQDKIYYMVYILQRLQTESLTFIWPPELMRSIENPAAAINTVKRISDLLENLLTFDITDDGEMDWHINNQYDRGLRKGEYKIKNRVLGITPWLKNYEKGKGILGLERKESMKTSVEFMMR